jgi:hypothetical protein
MSGTRQMAVGAATGALHAGGIWGQGAVVAADWPGAESSDLKHLSRDVRLVQDLHSQRGSDWDAILNGLGTRFPLVECHGFKVWPACLHAHTNAATLHLRNAYKCRQDVESITIVGGTADVTVVRFLHLKRRPKVTSMELAFHSPCSMMAKGVFARLHGGRPARPESARDGRPGRYRAGSEPVSGKGGSL